MSSAAAGGATVATIERTRAIDMQFSGTNTGQIAVGDAIVQYNADHGAIIYNAAPGEVPVVSARPRPVRLPGRRPPVILGREEEVAIGLQAVAQGMVVEFYGPVGIGKTTLLRHLADEVCHASQTSPDGVVYHEVAPREPLEDTLQKLWGLYFEASPAVPFKPTPDQLRHAFRDIRATVVIDDFAGGREGLSALLNTVPECNVVVSSSRRCLWGDGRSHPLRGLPEDSAAELLVRELGVAPDKVDRRVMRDVVHAVDGQPLSLLHVAALVTELGFQLGDVAADLAVGSGPEQLSGVLYQVLDQEQRHVLALLGTLDLASLATAHIGEVTGVSDVRGVLDRLQQLALVRSHSPRYSATVLFPDRSAPVTVQSREELIRWAKEQDQAEVVFQETPAMLAALDAALREEAWPDVLRLGRHLEQPLALTARWGTWKLVLDHQLTAARQLGDRAAEGWTLHQLGSRARCVGDNDLARSTLSEALRIREELRDVEGARVTRHNLDPLLPPHDPDSSGMKRAGPPVVPSSLGLPVVPLLGLLLLLMVGGALVTAGRRNGTVSSLQTVPLLTVQPDSLEFGPHAPGVVSASQSVVARNDGRGTATVGVAGLEADGHDAFRIHQDSCSGSRLAPGGSCSISVTYTPADRGVHVARLTIPAIGDGAHVVQLRGRGSDTTQAPENGGAPRAPVLPLPGSRPGPVNVDPSRGCGLQVPSGQALPYGSPVDLHLETASSAPVPATLGLGGPLPEGLRLFTNADGTGAIRGLLLGDPGTVGITVRAVCTEGRAERTFDLTILAAEVSLLWHQPLIDLVVGQPAVAKATLIQSQGTRGDPGRAAVLFHATNLLTGQVTVFGPVPVAADSTAATTVKPGDLPVGAYVLRARLSPATTHYRVRSGESPPAALMVSSDVLGATAYALSDVLHLVFEGSPE